MTALLMALCLFCGAHEPWTRGEVAGEAAYMTLHFVDWAQTRYIAKHLDAYHESFNPALTTQPSVGRVNMWFLGTTLLQPAIADWASRKWRDAWIIAGVTMEFKLTTGNVAVGIKMDLPW